MRALRRLFTFGCCLFTASLLHAQSAGAMASSCKQVVKAAVNQRITVLPRDFDSGMCWGAFVTVEQSVKPAAATKTQPAPGVCIPENTGRTRLIAAFIDFATSHPERAQEDFYLVARDALKAAFPCQRLR
jgi:hypothetical protein